MILAHPRRGERDQREPEEQVQVGQEHGPAHMRHRVEQVVVVVPVDAHVDEAEHVTEHVGQQGQQVRADVPSGTLNSSTMMVMKMAIIPSLKASMRLDPMVSVWNDEQGLEDER